MNFHVLGIFKLHIIAIIVLLFFISHNYKKTSTGVAIKIREITYEMHIA